MPKLVVIIDGKRQCKKCREWKDLGLFPTVKAVSCGRGAVCKQCINKHARQQGRLPEVKKRRMQRYEQKRLLLGLVVKPQRIVGNRKRCSMCGVWKKTDRFNSRPTNSSGLGCKCKKCKAEVWTKYYKKHGERVKETARKNRPKHRERIVRYREKCKPQRNLDERERAKIDIQFKLNRNIRSSMCNSLKYNGSKNGRHWEGLVGYTLMDLKKHLEKKFLPGMSWDNWGINGWHIDHKIPISAFNFTDPSHTDFKRCWSLKNLQPLWAFDNISKNDKLEKPFQPSLAL